MNRRNFIKKVGLLGAGYAINKNLIFANPVNGGIADSSVPFPIVRKELSERNFSSPAIEKAIATFKKEVKNKELGWLFENCFPNTLDTTVFLLEKCGRACAVLHLDLLHTSETYRHGGTLQRQDTEKSVCHVPR